jgi:small subunit ribosomal protein S20
MANHKSAKKRIKTSEKKRIKNKGCESKIKTLVKKVLASTEKTDAVKTYKEAVAFLDKSVAKGILHKNTASRRKSALTKHVNNIAASPTAE